MQSNDKPVLSYQTHIKCIDYFYIFSYIKEFIIDRNNEKNCAILFEKG